MINRKAVVRSTTFEHVKQKYVAASPSKRILWNKDSDSGLTGFVFESICAKVVLYDFCCNRFIFNVFQCLSNVILYLFNAILCLFNAILCPLLPSCAFLSVFYAFLWIEGIIGKIIDIENLRKLMKKYRYRKITFGDRHIFQNNQWQAYTIKGTVY